jgi:hypothetical protein
MTPEVTKTVLNKIILNVWIENAELFKELCQNVRTIRIIACSALLLSLVM